MLLHFAEDASSFKNISQLFRHCLIYRISKFLYFHNNFQFSETKRLPCIKYTLSRCHAGDRNVVPVRAGIITKNKTQEVSSLSQSAQNITAEPPADFFAFASLQISLITLHTYALFATSRYRYTRARDARTIESRRYLEGFDGDFSGVPRHRHRGRAVK